MPKAKNPKRNKKTRFGVSTPFKLYPVDFAKDGSGLAALFVAIFALFAISAPSTIVLEDDGLFVSAAWFAGVVHPPGYPLYTILGWLTSHLLPFGEIPWRVHLVSGFMGAITCCCIAFLLLRRTGNRPAAYLAAAALAVSEHFWSQAIIADVYTTNTALLFVAVVFALEATATGKSRYWLVAAGVYGLGLANHWPLLILGSPIFIAYIVVCGRQFWGKLHYLLPLAVIPAAMLYGWMVWRSHQAPPINFLGPINSFADLVTFIKRDIYAAVDTSPNASIVDKLQYIRYFLSEAFVQFSIAGGALALFGARCSAQNWRYGCYGEIATVLSSSLLLIALLGFDYEYIRIALFRPYLLVAYCILALWLGLGLHAVLQKFANRTKLATAAIVTICTTIIACLLWWNSSINYRADERFAEDYATSLFDAVEKDAVLVPHGDAYVFTSAYFHLVEGLRPDLRLVGSLGHIINDRIVKPTWTHPMVVQAWSTFAKNSDRPIYYQKPIVNERRGSYFSGRIYKVNKAGKKGAIILENNPATRDYFKKMLKLKSSDIWIANQRNFVLLKYGRYLGYAIALQNNKTEDYTKDILPLAEANYWSLHGIAVGLVHSIGKKQNSPLLAIADKYIAKAKLLADEQQWKFHQGQLLYLEGTIAAKLGKKSKAKDLFTQSIAINKGANNQAHGALARFR